MQIMTLCLQRFAIQFALFCSGKKVPFLWLWQKIIIPWIPAWKKGLMCSWPGEPIAAYLCSTPEKTISQIHSPRLRVIVDSGNGIGVSYPPATGRQPMYPGGLVVRQPYAGVNFMPPVRDCEFGYCFEHKAPLQFIHLFQMQCCRYQFT
jgi:hypothetical protein